MLILCFTRVVTLKLLEYDIDNGRAVCSIQICRDAEQAIIDVIEKYNVRLMFVGYPLYTERKAFFDTLSTKSGCLLKIINDGEGLKSLRGYEEILHHVKTAAIDRGASIAYFGGGSLGDAVGFAAATYMRGVGLVAFPTSLLAMVDSSLGGKNGIDMEDAKNIIGTFRNPDRIVCDISFLETGIDIQRQGIAEVTKYGLLFDPEIYRMILRHTNMQELVASDEIEKIIARCVDIKMNVVMGDPFETKGKREVLNYGHTIGHAVEAASHYSIPHGTAVLFGMKCESEILDSTGKSPDQVSQVVDSITEAYSMENVVLSREMAERMRGPLLNDKKIKSGIITLPRVVVPGKFEMLKLKSKDYLEVFGKWLDKF